MPAASTASLHAALETVALRRRRHHVIGVGRGAVADQLGERRRAARQRVIERFDDEHRGAFAHDKAVAPGVERARGAFRRFVEMRGQRARRGEAAETDTFDAAFRAAADRDIDLAGADHARAVADRLQAGGAGRDRRADRAAEAVADRHLPGGEVDQERRHGERRQLARPALVGGVHGLLHGGEAADPGADDGGGAIALGIAARSPARLRDGLVGGRQRELDEAVHPLVVFVVDDALEIETTFGILVDGRHHPGNLCGDVVDEIVRQSPYPGSAGEKPLPDHARPAPKRRNDAASGDDNPPHSAPAECGWSPPARWMRPEVDDCRP